MSKSLVVIGGAGALGRGISSRFAKASWKTFNIAYSKIEEVTDNVLLDHSTSCLQQTNKVLEYLKKSAGKVNAVVCAAGGWAGGSIKDAETLVNMGEMYSKNIESALMASHIAAHILSPGGLLVLTGSSAALNATPGMVSYGMSKAATHQLVANAASELPQDCTALGVLPMTIDTPMNRKFMPDADFTSWTKSEDIAEKILEWSINATTRPTSGHLLIVETKKNNQNTWKDIGNPFFYSN